LAFTGFDPDLAPVAGYAEQAAKMPPAHGPERALSQWHVPGQVPRFAAHWDAAQIFKAKTISYTSGCNVLARYCQFAGLTPHAPFSRLTMAKRQCQMVK